MIWPNDYINKAIQRDCLEVMRGMPDKCVDFIWTDIPYNVGKDYGNYKDNLPDIEYLSWIKKVISELKRLSNSIAIFIPKKYLLDIWNILGRDFQQIILTWNPEGPIKKGFINQYSSILVNVVPNNYCKNVWHNFQMTGLGYFFHGDNFGHPGYTSEEITGRVISEFGPGNSGIIFDPFLGTGTTAVMAKNLGHKYIGIEIDERWCEIARQRLRQEILL